MPIVTRDLILYVPNAHASNLNKVLEAAGFGPVTVSKDYRPKGGGAVVGKFGYNPYPVDQADMIEALADNGGTVPTLDINGNEIDWDGTDGNGDPWPSMGQRVAACAAASTARKNIASISGTAHADAILDADNLARVPEIEI